MVEILRFIPLVLLLTLTWRITYELFFSPLRHIPGSLLARLSSKYSILKRVLSDGPQS
ncbi:Cytochrome P450 monooxygenase helB4, partial [Aspergillus fumigatus]